MNPLNSPYAWLVVDKNEGIKIVPEEGEPIEFSIADLRKLKKFLDQIRVK